MNYHIYLLQFEKPSSFEKSSRINAEKELREELMRSQIEFNKKGADLFEVKTELVRLQIAKFQSEQPITQLHHQPSVIDLSNSNYDFTSVDMLQEAIDSAELKI